MKKGLIYYCLIASLVFHLLAIVVIRFEQAEKHKEKEPIAVDILGPLKWAPATKLPTQAVPPQRQAPPAPTRQAALPKQAERVPVERPRSVIPPLPIPAPLPVPQAPAQQGAAARPGPVLPPPSPEGVPSQVKPGGGGAATAQKAAPAPAPSAPQAGPKHFIRPSMADLERYASRGLEEQEAEKKKKDNEEITLDTDDLMFTSYLQGLKNRIELVWKYPETARRDGLQGQLVMKFSILKSGKLEDVELIKSSGYPLLDDAAKQALVDASPFNPLPDNWKKDRFTITGMFVYRLNGLFLR